MEEEELDSEEGKRSAEDRRQQPTPMFSRYTLLGGRRSFPRRVEEREGSFVDLYGPEVLAVFLLVMALNVFDSFFTLVYLQRGGLEANPVVQVFLDRGMVFFVALKTTIIGVALCVLCMCKNFQYARIGLQVAIWAYSVLAAYHLFLYFFTAF